MAAKIVASILRPERPLAAAVWAKSTSRLKRTLVVVGIGLLVWAGPGGPPDASAQPTATSKPDEATIADAYVYLLGRMLVIRQEHNDLKEDGIDFNVIKYNPLGSADFVNPNLDVAYLEAWLAVDPATPVILEVPEVRDRYYTAQILDEWGEVIVNINERTFPSKPHGKFALLAPGSVARIPAEAARIELHSSKAKLLARVELKADPNGAVALQRQFKLVPTGTPRIAPPVAIPDFDNRNLIGVDIFDNVDAVLSTALDVSPRAAEMQQKVRYVAHYVATDPDARASVERHLRHNVVPEFKQYAVTKSAPYRNHWVGGGRTGNYGSDYWLRSVVNYAGIWANTSDEVLYFLASRDSDENTLSGSNSYVIHFPADQLPQSVVNSYWSIILVGVPDYRVVPNPQNRFNLNTYSSLRNEPDGSLKIAIGPKPVAGVHEENWLPSANDKPFSLTFRAYVPKDVIMEGNWSPPAVTRLN